MENTTPLPISPIPPSVSSISPINDSPNVTKTTDNKTLIIAILLLAFVYPIGLIFMWFWTKWPLWLKIVLSLPVLLAFIAIPLAISLIAINPSKQFARANNTQRASDVNEILNAVYAYEAENIGNLPTGIDTTVRTIDSTGGSTSVNLCTTLVPQYIADMPIDPTTGTEDPVNSVCTDAGATYNTAYSVSVDASGKITVSAPKAELNTTISETR